MSLSPQIISQFAKVVNDKNKKNTTSDTTVYGKTVVYNGRTYVQLDGSDLLTPVDSTTSTKDGDRVTVSIKNHTATITGNLSDPSASSEKLSSAAKQISEFEIIIAHRVTAEEIKATNAYIENLKTISGKFDELSAVTAELEELKAKMANVDHLTATDIDAINAELENIRAEFGSFTDISTEDLTAVNAEIDNLKAYVGEFTYVSTDVLEAIKANIKTLDVEKLSAKDAELKYANIDFANIDMAAVEKLFTESGIIKDLVVSEGHITGELVGVTIKGDLIEANTVKADKLVVKGSDGIYYKLNLEAGVTSSEEVSKEELQNGLHGDTIIAKTITAEKVNVDDLVAFDATIGGFKITNNSIYSGVKSSVDNTTRGAYLDKDGQVAFGDANNFLKYYKDADDKYRLEISAASILFASSGKTVEETINETSNELQQTMTDQNAEIVANYQAAISDALEDYLKTGDFEAFENATSNAMNEIRNDIDTNNIATTDRINSVEAELLEKYAHLANWIHIDTETGTISLGSSETNLTLTLENDLIVFKKNGEPFGWWDGVDFHTGNIIVELNERAQFGNFAFIPRSDGSLSFLKVRDYTGQNAVGYAVIGTSTVG